MSQSANSNTCHYTACDWENPPSLQVNTDVSGLGVVVGFVATAYLVFIIIVVHYIISSISSSRSNVLDGKILHWIWNHRKSESPPSKRWGEGLRAVVLMFSDQQIVTGIAILAAGFSQLRCGISKHDWQVIVYLAWFSSCTHLSTLTVIRTYFRDHTAIRTWRLIAMLLMFLMLLAALVPSLTIAWTSDSLITYALSGMPARCFYTSSAWYVGSLGNFPGDASTSEPQIVSQQMTTVIPMLYLSSTYATRVVQLSEKASSFTRKWLLKKQADSMKWCLDRFEQRSNENLLFLLGYEMVLVLFVLCRAIKDLYGSMIWEILWLLYALLRGSFRISSGLPYYISRDSESLSELPQNGFWSFEQWLPVLLLLLPLLSSVELYYDTRQKILEEQSNNTKDAPGSPGRSSRVDMGEAESLIPLKDHDISTPSSQAAFPLSIVRTPTSLRSGRLRLVSSKHDYYRFPWFRVLLVLLPLVISALFLFVIIFTSVLINKEDEVCGVDPGPAPGSNFYQLYYYAARWLPATFGGLLCYTIFFVVLEDFKDVMASFLQSVLRIPRRYLRRADAWLPTVLGAVVVGVQLSAYICVSVVISTSC